MLGTVKILSSHSMGLVYVCLFLYVPILVQAALYQQARKCFQTVLHFSYPRRPRLPRVFALNQPAGKPGLKAAVTKLQVETYSGWLLLRKRSMSLEDSAQSALMNTAESWN